MYITATGGLDKSQAKKKTAKSNSNGFSEVLSSFATEESAAHSAASVNGVNQFLFLQEIDNEQEEKKETLNQAFDTIKHLDKIKMGLLSGSLSKETIIGLETLIAKSRKKFIDPNLLQIIDEIDLRAKVEIAKFSRD